MEDSEDAGDADACEAGDTRCDALVVSGAVSSVAAGTSDISVSASPGSGVLVTVDGHNNNRPHRLASGMAPAPGVLAAMARLAPPLPSVLAAATTAAVSTEPATDGSAGEHIQTMVHTDAPPPPALRVSSNNTLISGASTNAAGGGAAGGTASVGSPASVSRQLADEFAELEKSLGFTLG